MAEIPALGPARLPVLSLQCYPSRLRRALLCGAIRHSPEDALAPPPEHSGKWTRECGHRSATAPIEGKMFSSLIPMSPFPCHFRRRGLVAALPLCVLATLREHLLGNPVKPGPEVEWSQRRQRTQRGQGRVGLGKIRSPFPHPSVVLGVPCVLCGQIRNSGGSPVRGIPTSTRGGESPCAGRGAA